MVGDIVGRTGRYFFMGQTPELKLAKKIDMVVSTERTPRTVKA